MPTYQLIARAFRPDGEKSEILCIALRQETPESLQEIVWVRVPETQDLPDWETSLEALFLEKDSAGLLKSSWERIDFFAENCGVGDRAHLLGEIARLSFDTVSDPLRDPDTKQIWFENDKGKASCKNRKATGAISKEFDRSCLYIFANSQRQFLIANVRIRNLLRLSKGDAYHVRTWQIVVGLGANGKDAKRDRAIWEGGDLQLRDVLDCHGTGRQLTWQQGPVESPFPLYRIATPSNRIPEKGTGFALKSNLGKPFRARAWINQSASDFLRAERPVSFRDHVDTAVNFQILGLGFVCNGQEHSKKWPTALIRLYSYQLSDEDSDDEPFVIDDSLFDFQQQDWGEQARDGLSYRPRQGQPSQYVDWRVVLVRVSTFWRKTIPDLTNWWNERAGQAIVQSARTVRAGAPLSFVPLLKAKPSEEGKLAWMATVAVRDFVSTLRRVEFPTATERSPDLQVSPFLIQPARLPVRPGFEVTLDGAATVSWGVVKVEAALCERFQEQELASATPPQTADWLFPRAQFATDAHAITFGLVIDPTSGNEGWFKIGAFDLKVNPKSGKTVNDRWWWITAGERVERALGGGFVKGITTSFFRVETRIPVLVQPGNVDRLAREYVTDVKRGLTDSDFFQGSNLDARFEPEAPLVIDLQAGAPESLLLVASEAVQSERDHNLALILLAQGSDPAPSEDRLLMVIDRTPFAVYLLRVGTLSSLADAETAVVAVWEASGEGGAHWRMYEGKRLVELFLPPQNTAEAMEKGGGDSRNPAAGLPVDFRFGPLARLLIDPSFQDQRFGEVPWNVRRLFGYPEQRVPGSRLLGFDVELLYGLIGQATGLDGIMIAEVEARLGRPPGRQETDLRKPVSPNQSDYWNQYRERWSDIRAQLLSRLAVLETYDLRPGENVIRDGLAWYQRGSNPGPRGADYRGPALALPFESPSDEDRARFSNALFHDEGLPGGWTWGFTSLNVLEAVLRNPKSTSGFLSGLKFSALGGWGYLKAAFDEDRSSVYGRTSMGRTQFYSLERIGRIGVFWNRAKHVIVFERTVAPSEQFYQKQTSHYGRPLVRKVHEFIELLEPERAFPDSRAPKASRGCVLGLSFKSKIIAVDSKWGQDVGSLGWKVPLWNPKAFLENPRVYPLPKINFVLAADPQADIESIFAPCSTPELLMFYTDTQVGTGADTNKWEPVLGVDYGVGSARWQGDVKLPGFRNDPQAALPAEIAVPPGLHEFTFGIEPPEQPVNLTIDRTDEPINAVLRNVTVMRAQEAEPGSTASEAQKAVKNALLVHEGARALEHALKELQSNHTDGEELIATARGVVKRIAGELTTPAKVVQQFYNGPFTGAASCGALANEAGKLYDRWATSVLTLAAESGGEVITRIKGLEIRLADRLVTSQAKWSELIEENKERFRSYVQDVGDQLVDGIDAGAGSVLRAGRTSINALDQVDAEIRLANDLVAAKCREVQAATAACISLADAATEAFFDRVAALRNQARAALQQAAEALEKIERVGAAHASRVKGLQPFLNQIGRARARLTELVGLVDTRLLLRILSLRNSGQGEFGAVLTQIKAEIDRCATAVATEIEQALGTLQDVLKTITLNLDGANNQVRSGFNALRAMVEEVAGTDEAPGMIQRSFAKILEELGESPGAAELAQMAQRIRQGEFTSVPIATLWEKARATANSALTNPQQRAAVLQKATELCEALRDAVTPWLNGADDAVEKAAEELTKELNTILDKAQASFEEARTAVEEVANRVVSEAAIIYEQTREALAQCPVGPVLQNPDAAIRLVRAFGEPPRLPKLDFNRVATAFVFGKPADAIDLTPVTAWFDQVGGDLKALGIQLPTDKLLDRLIPSLDFKDLGFGKLLPDFAGLKLDKLFPSLAVPKGLGDAIVITHGLDRQRQRAWAEANVEISLDDDADLFTFGPLTLTLHRADLKAFARLETGLDGKVERQSRGSLTADWELRFGGQQLVTFRETALRFDESGQTRFDLSPDRMEMAPALAYLSDLAKQLNYQDDAFVFRILERNGIPYGAEALFDIMLPPLQYGTTGLIGATIGASMRLEAYPEFVIDLAMNVSRRDSPFIFSIFILGGAGFVEAKARYLPFRDSLSADVSVGLAVSASLAFAFGPVSGQVAVSLGVAVEFHRRPGQHSGGLGLTFMLLIVGRVDVCGIVTVHLSLLLEATYEDTGQVKATGTLRISVRISRFFKITVTTRVTYDFKSGKSESSTNQSIETHPAYAKAKALAKAAA